MEFHAWNVLRECSVGKPRKGARKRSGQGAASKDVVLGEVSPWCDLLQGLEGK